jgi:hypothetical protein
VEPFVSHALADQPSETRIVSLDEEPKLKLALQRARLRRDTRCSGRASA